MNVVGLPPSRLTTVGRRTFPVAASLLTGTHCHPTSKHLICFYCSFGLVSAVFICCCNLCFYFLGHLLVQSVLPLCPVTRHICLITMSHSVIFCFVSQINLIWFDLIFMFVKTFLFRQSFPDIILWLLYALAVYAIVLLYFSHVKIFDWHLWSFCLHQSHCAYMTSFVN